VSSEQYDLVIIGAGPGGYVAAIHAAQKGLKVALVEAREPGGVCLHAGCIPTKAMIASADLLRQARAAAQWGVEIPSATASLANIAARRDRIVRQLAQGVRFLLQKNGVELIAGRGSLASAGSVEIRDNAGQVLRVIDQPRAILLATGSHPAELPGLAVDHQNILNSNDMLALKETPADLLILGGGYIGCEFASLFAALGAKVTVIEAMPNLLPGMDTELGQTLERSFKRVGIQVRLNTRVQAVQAGQGVQATLSDGQVVTGAKMLVSVGRTPNLADIGLEKAGVAHTPKGIGVDGFLRTNVPGILAIGDVTGKMALAHVASAQGKLAVEHLAATLAGTPLPAKSFDYDAVPACVFTHPEIAAVGLTEAEAARRGIRVRVGKFPFMAAGKAMAAGATDGFVKLIANEADGRLVGGHIMGAHASELIATVALGVRCGLTVAQVTETVFAHPTLGEAVLEAAEGIFGKSTNIVATR
jgi:dihydrolipoamide dehydrogenase